MNSDFVHIQGIIIFIFHAVSRRSGWKGRIGLNVAWNSRWSGPSKFVICKAGEERPRDDVKLLFDNSSIRTSLTHFRAKSHYEQLLPILAITFELLK